MLGRLHQSQAALHAALCDSFNTPEAINVIRDLVASTNIYITTRGANLDVSVVERIARWTGQMLRMFGLGEGESSEIGWGQELSPGEASVNVRPIFSTLVFLFLIPLSYLLSGTPILFRY